MVDPNQYLTPLDFFLAPFIAAIIYLTALRIRKRYYPIGHPWRPYFMPGLIIKLIGAISIGLIYTYYYNGGDTFNYHYHARVINSALNESIGKWFNLLFSIPPPEKGEYYEYISQMYWYKSGSTYTVSAITAFLSAPLGSLYLPTGLLFAFIAFSGQWAIFRVFAKLYPNLVKQIAIATLFVPSLALWGSSIFKDTISMFALGWLCYSVIQILAYRNFNTRNIVILVVSFLLTAKVKMYINFAITPPIIVWGTFQRLEKIKNKQIKIIASIFSLIIIIAAIGAVLSASGELRKELSLEKLASTSATTRGWISYVSTIEQGSGYDLGTLDPGLSGLLTKFPQAVNVTFFRPYVWEARKVIVFLSAIESLLLLILTVKVLTTIGLKKVIQTIFAESTIQFCLIFSLLFAFSVGISSYNFGSLSRYKIPCIPFFIIALVLIYYKNKPLKKPLLKVIGI